MNLSKCIHGYISFYEENYVLKDRYDNYIRGSYWVFYHIKDVYEIWDVDEICKTIGNRRTKEAVKSTDFLKYFRIFYTGNPETSRILPIGSSKEEQEKCRLLPEFQEIVKALPDYPWESVGCCDFDLRFDYHK